ncbi:MAG: hypothetical protein ACFFAO_21320, partial [Candidatus Hermodarchaeota archaeon]
SFSDHFNNLGFIRELKLSNTDLKLSFLKDKNTNTIYLATFDNNSNSIDVHKFLKKISQNFLNKYNISQLKHWDGRRERFETFEREIDKHFKFSEVEEKEIDNNKSKNEIIIQKEDELNEVPKFYNYVPNFRSKKKINPKYYITSETSHQVFDHIDGKKNIFQIAKIVNLEVNQVYGICKSLVKFGFISLGRD